MENDFNEAAGGITRRTFVKGGAAVAAVGATGALAGCTAPQTQNAAEEGAKPAQDEGVWLPSQCNMCFNACSILGHVVDGKLVEIKGDDRSPAGWGHLCGKGTAGIMQLYDENRITKPMKRTNPEEGRRHRPGLGGDQLGRGLRPHLGEAGRAAGEEQARHRVRAHHEHHLVDRLHELAGQQRQHAHPVQGRHLRRAHASHLGAAHRLRQRAARLRALQVPHAVRHAGRRGHAPWHEHHGEGVRRGARERLQAGELRPAYVGRGREGRRVGAHPPRHRRRGGARDGEPAGERVRPIRQGVPRRRTNGPSLVDPATQRIVRDASKGNKALYWDLSDNTAKALRRGQRARARRRFRGGRHSVRTAFSIFKDSAREVHARIRRRGARRPADTTRRLAKEFGEAACIGQTVEVDGLTVPYRPVPPWTRSLALRGTSMASSRTGPSCS